MRVWIRVLSVAALLVAGGLGYHKAMARLGSGTPPEMAAAEQQADRIVVDKSERRLDLLKGYIVLATYRISLGSAGDAGPK